MTNVDSLVTLISAAREKLHTDSAIAAYLGETPQNFAGLKAGRRRFTAIQIAQLCELVGMAPEHSRVWLAMNAIRNAGNEEDRERMEHQLIGTLREIHGFKSQRKLKAG